MEPTNEVKRIANLVNTSEFMAGLLNGSVPEDKQELDDIVYQFLLDMNDMQLTPDLANRALLKKIYLEDAPRDWPFLPEDTYKVQLVLMRLYYILGREGIILETDAEEMVLFLQGAQDTFFRNFQDVTRFSPEKQEFYTMTQAAYEEFGQLSGLSDLLRSSLDDEEDFSYLTDENFAYQVRVDLEGFKPPIWRRLIIPATVTYEDLHEILQIAFDWKNQHLWNFTVDGRRIVAVEDDFSDSSFGEEPEIANEIMVDDDFDLVNSLTYLYDFGDDWIHKIKIEKRLNDDHYMDEGPKLVKLVGDTPAEDSRGTDTWVKADAKKIEKALKKFWVKGMDEGRF